MPKRHAFTLEENKALARRAIKALNRRTIDLLDELVAPDARLARLLSEKKAF